MYKKVIQDNYTPEIAAEILHLMHYFNDLDYVCDYIKEPKEKVLEWIRVHPELSPLKIWVAESLDEVLTPQKRMELFLIGLEGWIKLTKGGKKKKIIKKSILNGETVIEEEEEVLPNATACLQVMRMAMLEDVKASLYSNPQVIINNNNAMLDSKEMQDAIKQLQMNLEKTHGKEAIEATFEALVDKQEGQDAND